MNLPAKNWIAFLFWISGITLFSSLPKESLAPGLFPQSDKLFHFAAFTLGGWLASRTGMSPWLAWLVCALFGAVDEWHQSFTPGRSTEFADWLADTAGAAAGVWMATSISHKTRAQHETTGS